MKLDKFYAVTATEAPHPCEGGDSTIKLDTVSLGILALPSESVNISDALILSEPLIYDAPATTGEVVITRADVSTHQDGSRKCVAYMSLLFSREQPHSVEPAIETDYDTNFDLYTDTGLVGFYDTLGHTNLSITGYLDYHEDEIAALISSAVDKAEAAGVEAVLTEYPKHDSETLMAVSVSGWGDGRFPVLQTLSEDGHMLGLHVDFLVVGEDALVD